MTSPRLGYVGRCDGSRLEPERAEEAKVAVRAMMWPDGDGPRRFRNETQFIIGRRVPIDSDARLERRGPVAAVAA